MMETKEDSLPGTGIDPEWVANSILRRAQHGAYTPIDMDKPILVKYLRATPIFQPKTGVEHGVIPGTGVRPYIKAV